jgi:NhaA family Na+:H+ antiporter
VSAERNLGGRVRDRVEPLTEYLHDEAAGGLVLLGAAIAALVWANSPVSDSYFDLWHTHLDLGLDLSLQHWVNDGLMALFFFVVGLEIKRELVCGELRDPRAAALPAIAAVAGVALPALIFVAFTAGTDASAGWAIPAATDIAFAVGILALLGDRVPSGLRLFLLAVAIIDDVIAIAIIALFYSDAVSLGWLAASVGIVGVVVAMRLLGVWRISWYVLPALALWVAVHESGVHATIAGVVLGLLTPTGAVRGRNVLELLEHRLHPLSAFVVVPLFALANAGVDFGGGKLSDALGSTITWAVVAGLLVGKPVGIAGATWVALRLRAGVLPDGVAFRHVIGAGALGGIGFTVSIFIAGLAFDDGGLVDDAKVGIFLGSLGGGLLGAVLLLTLGRARRSRG